MSNTSAKPFSFAAAATVLVVALSCLASSRAQTPPPAKAAVQADPAPPPLTPGQLKAQAWTMLTTANTDVKHPDTRIQALAALGLMGSNPRSVNMIEDAMGDRDLDLRTAAALAAGQTKAPALEPGLRRLLDDKEPQVAYAAALQLWKMGDHAGEDILLAVVDGDRRASATLIGGTEHTVSKDLHSPATIAKIGALQGASMLLGPFGIGVTAYEYIRRNGGGDSARVTALESLAEDKSEAVKKALLAALGDKDQGVRAAAAKALASYHQAEVSTAIAALFADPKQPVRLTAAAAYLVSTGESPGSRAARRPATRRPH